MPLHLFALFGDYALGNTLATSQDTRNIRIRCGCACVAPPPDYPAGRSDLRRAGSDLGRGAKMVGHPSSSYPLRTRCMAPPRRDEWGVVFGPPDRVGVAPLAVCLRGHVGVSTRTTLVVSGRGRSPGFHNDHCLFLASVGISETAEVVESCPQTATSGPDHANRAQQSC